MVTCIATAGSGSGRLPPVHRADSYRTGLGGLQRVSSTPSGRAAKLHTYGELADATHIPTPILIWLPTAGREASVRQALAGEGRWSTVQARVATASPTLGNGPADAAWLPLGHQAMPPPHRPHRPRRPDPSAHRTDPLMARSSSEDIDARIRAVVERTIRDQGLDLEVRDPAALYTVAALILAVRRKSGERNRAAS